TSTAYLLNSLYFGTLLALGIYNLLLFFSVGDRTYLLYVAFVVGMGLGVAGQTGVAAQFIWPDSPLLANYAFPVGFAITGLFASCFTRAFLDTPRQLPHLNRLLVWLGFAFGFGALLSMVDYSLGAQFTSAVGVLFTALAVSVGLLSWRRGNPSARLFLLAWLILLIGAFAMALRTLNLVPTNAFTLYGMQFGSALEMLLLSFALADRINHTRREKLAAQAEALAAERKLREMLEDNERRLEARVTERTRELEDANRQLQENEERFRHMAQHDPLTGLANRLLLYDRLEHLLHRSRRSGAAFAILMLDLDGFKQVNDTYGHATGDALLAEIAERLQKRMRASDTVARIGGDEFAVLLEPTTGAEEAQRVANNLLTEVVRPIELGPQLVVSVGGSIGVSLWPRDGDDADTLLHAADQAMYRAKANSHSGISG
ncbi:MAG TPA: diguanylate cyclase, partial [Rhodocyclaceae bacterium]|nr:diguanylate cyclase [Rhodocyclaceae bacterium]